MDISKSRKAAGCDLKAIFLQIQAGLRAFCLFHHHILMSIVRMFTPHATANINSRGKNRIHLVQTQESHQVLGEWKGKTHPSQNSGIGRIERWLMA